MWARMHCSSTTRHRPDPTLAFALSRLSSDRTCRRRSACSATWNGPVYELEVTAQVDDEIGRKGPGDLAELIGSGATWTVD